MCIVGTDLETPMLGGKFKDRKKRHSIDVGKPFGSLLDSLPEPGLRAVNRNASLATPCSHM